jgi:phospholipid transport system substrate-binding protein
MTKGIATWLFITAAAASSAVTPRDLVQSAVLRVIHVLEEPGAKAEGAPAPTAGRPANDRVRLEVRRIAAELFDFEEISRRALSRHWAGRSKEEQQEFTGLFTELLERSYVGKIEGYSGEKIAYTGEAVDGDYATVRSRIVTKRRGETALDYRLHRTNGRWKVYDVVIDGVSFVSTYRSEFNRVIQAAGYDELMERLRKKQIEIRTVVDRAQN